MGRRGSRAVPGYVAQAADVEGARAGRGNIQASRESVRVALREEDHQERPDAPFVEPHADIAPERQRAVDVWQARGFAATAGALFLLWVLALVLGPVGDPFPRPEAGRPGLDGPGLWWGDPH